MISIDHHNNGDDLKAPGLNWCRVEVFSFFPFILKDENIGKDERKC